LFLILVSPPHCTMRVALLLLALGADALLRHDHGAKVGPHGTKLLRQEPVATAAAAATPATTAEDGTAQELDTVAHTTQNIKDMMQSMLVANAQQMSALNAVQEETHRLRARLDEHQNEVLHCKQKLADMEQTTRQAFADEQMANSTPWPTFGSILLQTKLKESLLETRKQLQTVLEHI